MDIGVNVIWLYAYVFYRRVAYYAFGLHDGVAVHTQGSHFWKEHCMELECVTKSVGYQCCGIFGYMVTSGLYISLLVLWMGVSSLSFRYPSMEIRLKDFHITPKLKAI